MVGGGRDKAALACAAVVPSPSGQVLPATLILLIFILVTMEKQPSDSKLEATHNVAPATFGLRYLGIAETLKNL